VTLPAKTSVSPFGLLVAAVMAALGCTRPPAGPPLVPTSGRVTLGGSPVTSGVVTFFDSGLQGTSAALDGDGRYRVQTIHGDGLPPGDYRVTVMPIGPAADPARPGMAHEAMLARKPPPTSLPATYQAVESTPLHVSVSVDVAEIRFDMPLQRE
jgi:hypothetical protein